MLVMLCLMTCPMLHCLSLAFAIVGSQYVGARGYYSVLYPVSLQ
jgi:hypothetical protein